MKRVSLILTGIIFFAGELLYAKEWFFLFPAWNVNNNGLSCVYTNRKFNIKRDIKEENAMVNIFTAVPKNKRTPDSVRIFFDVKGEFSQYGMGFMFADKGNYLKFFLIVDNDKVLVELTFNTNNNKSFFKKVYQLSDLVILKSGNELVWNKKRGTFVLNSKVLFDKSPFSNLITARRFSLFGMNSAVSYRRLKFINFDNVINSASQGMSESSIVIFDEIFDSKTKIKMINIFGNITEDTSGAMDVMGP